MLSLLLLSVPSLSTPGTSHSALHPAALDFYVELPDVSAFVDLAQSSPLGRFLHDPEFLGSLAALTKQPELSESSVRSAIDGAPALALGSLGLPLDALKGATISLSIDGLRNSLPAALERVARWKSAHADVARLTGELHTLATLPATLAELPSATGSAPRDPWDREYVYVHDATAGSFAVKSLGADGVEGGDGDAADLEIDTDVSRVPTQLIAQSVGLTFAISFADETHAKLLHDLMLGQLEPALGTGTVGRAGEHTFIYRDVPAWLHREGSTVALGAGDVRVADAIARLRGQPATGARALVEETAARLGAPKSRVVWLGYQAASFYELGQGLLQAASGFARGVDLEGPLKNLAPMLSEVAATTSTAHKASPCAWRTEFDGTSFTAVSVEPTPTEGFTALIGRTPIDASSLLAVPAAAQAYWSASIDGAALGKQLFSLLGQQNGQSDEQWLASMEKSTGMRLDKALFDNLRGTATVYAMPWKSLGLPPVLAVLPLKDPAAFNSCVEHLGALLPADLGEKVKIATRPYKDVAITTISGTNVGAGMVALQPALCVMDGNLYLASSPTPLKDEIRRTKEGKSEQHASLAGASNGSSLACSTYYVDWASILGDVLAMGANMAKMMGGDKLPIDVAKLPKRELLARHFKPTNSRTESRDGWSYTTTRGSFGPETPLILAAAAAAVGAQHERHVDAAQDAQPNAIEAEAQPAAAPTEAPPASPSDRTQSALQQVRNALAIYKVDRSAYPATLQELGKPSANYPQGYLAAGALPLDGWGHDLRYELTPGGPRYRLWSIGADGIDQNGEGDDQVAGVKK